MDDRDLEARLTAHLHRRFDVAKTPPQLVAGVERGLATEARRVTRPTMRIGRLSLGWAALAAVAVVAALALTSLRFGIIGPGAASPSPAATFSAPPVRQFLVLPATAVIPAAPDVTLAVQVLSNRLEALGLANVTSSTTFGIQFEVSVAGPTNEVIRRVLGANGDIEFVPLPKADYDDAGITAVIGKPLPVPEPALFGGEAIATIGPGDTGAPPTVSLTLDHPATVAFADYTLKHAGETLAIVIDGRVALLPIIREPMAGGEIEISGGIDDDFATAAAIMIGGRLPDAWRDPVVPVVRSEDSILAELPDLPKLGAVESMELMAMRIDGHWRAVWHIDFGGNVNVYVDAETAQFVP